LRDASAFNVQYDGERPRLIDTLSVGPRIADSPWVAYGQFCAHYLAPLTMAAYQDVRMLSLWRSHIDGFPLDLAVSALPFLKRFRPGYFMHLILHARFQASADKLDGAGDGKPKKKPRVDDRGLIGLIRSLRKAIRKTRWERSSKIWEGYEEIRTYADDDVARKRERVENVVRRLNPGVVWDLGANTGEFSEIAAGQGAFTVAVDGDPACAENIYLRHCRGGGVKNILPLTMDLANPSPSLGWDGQERPSLKERGPADLVLALALIHHLVLTCCVPLSKIAEWFCSLTSGHLLVEYVPLTDPMAKKLLESREDAHLPYSREVFESDFSRFFDLEDQTPLANGRILYLCKRR
ncbi:MAG: SAM-dependent methyltransferase, partial [Desulfobacterales bacterium]|nr:SAM-dependent methyltransferase [Desulfobacterales bacterium]